MMEHLNVREQHDECVTVSNQTLRFRAGDVDVWTLPISRIAVVAEVNLAADPLFDDYFLTLVDNSGCIFVIPISAPGWGECLSAISEHCTVQLRCHCANVTIQSSRVMWPVELAGTPLLNAGDEGLALTPAIASEKALPALVQSVRRYLSDRYALPI